SSSYILILQHNLAHNSISSGVYGFKVFRYTVLSSNLSKCPTVSGWFVEFLIVIDPPLIHTAPNISPKNFLSYFA
uniref:Uncharacterized protein n=1 Tax=Megaselia scalaris TaxID=36166 RepID=T1GML9_MEGSC